MVGVPKDVQEQIELEKRALAVVYAALNDSDFMEGVLTAYRTEVNGAQGKPWAQVKAELGIA